MVISYLLSSLWNNCAILSIKLTNIENNFFYRDQHKKSYKFFLNKSNKRQVIRIQDTLGNFVGVIN